MQAQVADEVWCEVGRKGRHGGAAFTSRAVPSGKPAILLRVGTRSGSFCCFLA